MADHLKAQDHLERAWEIVCELEQHGHPCDCDFCHPMWREIFHMLVRVAKQDRESKKRGDHGSDRAAPNTGTSEPNAKGS